MTTRVSGMATVPGRLRCVCVGGGGGSDKENVWSTRACDAGIPQTPYKNPRMVGCVKGRAACFTGKLVACSVVCAWKFLL